MVDAEKVKAGLEHCDKYECIGCPYRGIEPTNYGEMLCFEVVSHDALEAIARLEERIAIMQESMDTLEKRCNTLNTLKQRCGHWVNRGKDLEAHSMEVFDAWSCSRCRYYIHGNGYPKWKYCPMCGCKMNEVSK